MGTRPIGVHVPFTGSRYDEGGTGPIPMPPSSHNPGQCREYGCVGQSQSQTTLRSNGSELMPLARMSLHHSLAVNRLWSR
ncbi:Uncharacterised protein [Bifidobacterium bifidum]|nr:hypothetical protein BBIF_1298 [Bifidobacterium bifidum S17]CUN06264.1 Uncharacterised protein [Bifidobacterium bifidum]